MYNSENIIGDADKLYEAIGKICHGNLSNGRKFCSKLVGIHKDSLEFETKKGLTIFNKRVDIVQLNIYPMQNNNGNIDNNKKIQHVWC